MIPEKSSLTAYELEKQTAIAVVTAAASLCEQIRQDNNSLTLAKADTSPVTIADFGTQALICQALATNFPNDPIIGEEDARMLQKPESQATLTMLTQKVQQILPQASSEEILTWIDHGNGTVAPRYWTLDPIDGTKGYIRGDQYAIALALIEEGEVKLGVVGCPSLSLDSQETGVIFVALKGQGTTIMPFQSHREQPIKVNISDDVSQLCLIESVETAHSDRTLQHKIAEIIGLGKPTIRMDSLAKYGMVALGKADLYLRIPLPQFYQKKENIWDHAAGAILVTEAGGCVTDLDGKSLDFSVGTKLVNNRGIVVSNGVIHDQVLQIMRELNV